MPPQIASDAFVGLTIKTDALDWAFTFCAVVPITSASRLCPL
jgi:hypothetical protein